jgi:hypothetical protein
VGGSAVLLQVPSRYFGNFGSAAVPAWLIVLLSLAAVAVVVFAVLAARRNPANASSPEQQRRNTHRAFVRAARAAGLSKEQTAMLERLVSICRVKQPPLVFSSSTLLDDVLKRGVYALEGGATQDPKKHAQLRMIYTTKQIIENAASGKGTVRSTLALKPGQSMSVTPEGGGARCEVSLVANPREVLAVTTPRDASGKEQRWAKGTRCVLSFTREADASYSFPSKVVGYNTFRGVVCMLLQHAKTLQQDQQRRQRRRDLSRPCFCYPVKVVTSGAGRKAERKAVVQQNEKVIGTVSDISAGGCSVRARQPLKAGTLVKVELSITRRDTLSAFGKVMRVRQERQGGVMHVMFTRLSAAALNRIYSYVYDYTAMG